MAVRYESIICPGCGCLCDDLDITLEHGRITAVANVCGWGAGRFLQAKKLHPERPRHRLQEPQVRRLGYLTAASYDAALNEAAQILRGASCPVIYGLTNSGSWTQEAALKLARQLNARLEPGDLAFTAPYYQTIARHPLFWAPLEVIRDEADAVLFWGANPIHSAPRHVVRHAVFARGRFTERGLEDRQVAAVDAYRTELAKFCHWFIRVEPGQEAALVTAVHRLLQGGAPPDPLIKGTRRLTRFLEKATYGVIFCGRGIHYAPSADLYRRLAELVAGLNTRAPFVLFPLSGDFNSAGLYHLLLSRFGHPGAPDFRSAAAPESSFTPVDFKHVDALLVTGADLLWDLPEAGRQDLKCRQVPVITLSPFANRTTAQSQVIFPVALDGVETEEVAYRMDGLPLLLQPPLTSEAPPARRVLDDLCQFI